MNQLLNFWAAILAPSTMAPSLAQAISGWTVGSFPNVANPQSEPACTLNIQIETHNEWIYKILTSDVRQCWKRRGVSWQPVLDVQWSWLLNQSHQGPTLNIKIFTKNLFWVEVFTLSSGIWSFNFSKVSTSCAWRGLADSNSKMLGLADITI